MLHNSATKNKNADGHSFRHFFSREHFFGKKYLPRGPNHCPQSKKIHQVAKSTSPGRQPCFKTAQQKIKIRTAILFGIFFHVSTFLGGGDSRGAPTIARRAEKNGKKGETASSAVSVTLLLK
jgi:hypothetical protein